MKELTCIFCKNKITKGEALLYKEKNGLCRECAYKYTAVESIQKLKEVERGLPYEY